MRYFKKMLAKFMNRNERKTSDGPETAIQQFHAVIEFVNLFAYFVGIELTSNWEFNLRAKSNIIMNFSLVWVEFYTFYLLFPSVVCVELTAGILVTAPTITKFAFFMFNHKKFMSLVDFIYDIANKNKDGRRQKILLDVTKTIYNHFKLAFCGFFCGAAVYMFYPVYDYLINGNLTPVSPLIFPLNDDTTGRGYIISTILNIIPPGWNVLGIAAASCIFMTFVDVYAGLISLIDNDLSKFDGLWTKECNNNLRNIVFGKIMLEIMDLARYNVMLNDLFSLIATVEIASSFFGSSASLFGYLANDFYGGVGATIYFLTQMLMLCYIGQIMDNQTERIQMVIFHSDWYVYEVRYQKDLMFALYIVQNLRSVAVAGIMPLNFETGVTAVKNIYSILMFLLNALE